MVRVKELHSEKVPRRTTRRKRRRHSSSGSENEETEKDFPIWKTCLVIGVLVGCFAVLYPKMFHPMLMFVFNSAGPKNEGEKKEFAPGPEFRGGAGSPHVHAGPHPGARMAASMAQQYKGDSGSGGGKGMWHWMLPFYSVGVILFLLYTLSKILWRQPSNPGANQRYGLKYNARRDRFQAEGEDDMSSEEELPRNKNKQGNLNSKQLKGLQSRLEQTESAMHKILEQLETITDKVDPGAAENVKQMTMETLANLHKTASVPERDESTEDEDEDVPLPKHEQYEQRYINDLENALSDFQNFTESYIKKETEKAGVEMKEHVQELKKEVEEMQGINGGTESESVSSVSGETTGTSDGAGEASDGAGGPSDGAVEPSDGAGGPSDGAGEPSDGVSEAIVKGVMDVMECEKNKEDLKVEDAVGSLSKEIGEMKRKPVGFDTMECEVGMNMNDIPEGEGQLILINQEGDNVIHDHVIDNIANNIDLVGQGVRKRRH